MLIAPNGTKAWRIKYTRPYHWKEARERVATARKDIVNDIDPSEKRKLEKAACQNSFEAVAFE